MTIHLTIVASLLHRNMRTQMEREHRTVHQYRMDFNTAVIRRTGEDAITIRR